MRNAIEEGYKAAEKSWGGQLPEICKQTQEATLKGLDDWAQEATQLVSNLDIAIWGNDISFSTSLSGQCALHQLINSTYAVNKKTEFTAPYTCLGFAEFQSHYSAPISIVWKMKESLPGL